MMHIRLLKPYQDIPQLQDLWKRCLGEDYPISDATLNTRIWKRESYLPGETLVVKEQRNLIGCLAGEYPITPFGPQPASINAILIDPAFRGRGIGRELVRHATQFFRDAGARQITVSTGPWRFWPGVPDNCEGAADFFTACGFGDWHETVDLCGPRSAFHPDPAREMHLQKAGLKLTSAAAEDIPAVFTFLHTEQPSWLATAAARLYAGDWEHFLLLKEGDRIAGCIQTFPPNSRLRSANLVWERLYTPALGGFGAVLIGKADRGRGLGAALCQGAARYIYERGASHCYIDWTSRNLAHLYRKVGTEICRTYLQFQRTIKKEPSP